jgi:crotonobetainyl-CoA:carnitine CoA-transferase CaiB-like acyl-CoA transferase
MASLLSGVRVLDMTTVVAGPTASMILAELGANVIKVEPAGKGEDARRMGPHRGEWGAYFVALNCGKRSIGIDLRTPAGREAVLRIAATCDVFLENFRSRKTTELGLHEDAVRARKPDIIYASLSAFGPAGPDQAKAGYDALVQARTGIMSVTGAGGPPVRAGVSIIDVGTGVWMALGILGALLERERSGKGQRVDASLFGTGISLMAYHLLYRQFAGTNPVPQGSRHTAFAPYGAFASADGYLMIGISGDNAFQRLCDALGRKEWTTDPRFRTNPDRVSNCDELERLMTEILKQCPSEHWAQLLDSFDVANAPVQNAEQVLTDPQLAALSQMGIAPLLGAGSATVPRLPVDFSAFPRASMESRPPRPGEHTRTILSEAGYTDTAVDELIREGAAAEG